MIGNMFDTSGIATLERVVSFTATRQEILANNIANIDTPGYKVRDLDVDAFQEHLKQAIARGRSDRGDAVHQPKIDFDQYLLFHDRNNRSIEKQMTAMAKNGITNKVAVELLRSRYQLLEQAIALKL